MSRRIRLMAVLMLLVGGAGASAQLPYRGPSILPLREQKVLMDSWVKLRLERLLPEEMRRYGFDMWLVICNENVEDPVFRPLVPEDPWAVRRLGMLVFYDRGAAGIERIIVAHHEKDFYTKDWNEGKETQWEALARVVKARNPKRIGIDQAVKIPYGDGLTAGLKQKLVAALGPELASRLQPAEELAVAMLERRMPEEIAVYHHVEAIAHAMIRDAFSSSVITPEVTTLDDLDWWFNQRVVDMGLQRWFFNDTTLVRAGAPGTKDRVIRRGDVIHCDVGLKYLGLNTDTQELAYVLREGETDARPVCSRRSGRATGCRTSCWASFASAAWATRCRPPRSRKGEPRGSSLGSTLTRLACMATPPGPLSVSPTIRRAWLRRASTRSTPTRRIR